MQKIVNREKNFSRYSFLKMMKYVIIGIPDIFMDEIIVNPERLQTSSLILTHPSQVTAEGG